MCKAIWYGRKELKRALWASPGLMNHVEVAEKNRSLGKGNHSEELNENVQKIRHRKSWSGDFECRASKLTYRHNCCLDLTCYRGDYTTGLRIEESHNLNIK